MKGIILAGGRGTRLYPATHAVSKQLLPLYDKPMVYYPLTTLMLAGIRDILIITTVEDASLFEKALGDGSQWGISLSYAQQQTPKGLADALIIGEDFISNDNVCLILGDNLLYGHGLALKLQKLCQSHREGAVVFGYYVRAPERYGVISFDSEDNVTAITEKPKKPASHYAAIGLYIYDSQAANLAKQVTPSWRGELEITDVNNLYLQQNQLQVEKLSRGYAWLDTGTHDSLIEAAQFIQVLEHRQNLKIGSPEEVAWRMKFIDDKQLSALAEPLMKSDYGQYLLALLLDR